MICKLVNKMEQFCSFILCPVEYVPNEKVSLSWALCVFFVFFICLFVVSWWLIPIRFILKYTDEVMFYCKKGE